MQIIMDNAFTLDSHGRRTVRFLLLSENIEANAAEIGLPDELKNWGISAYDNWMNALSKAGMERGERDMAFETYHALFADAREYYLNTKELLWALIADTENGIEIAEKYGIIGRTSEILGPFLGSIKLFKDASDDLRASGDPRVLAEAIVDNVVAKSQDAADAYQTAQNERKESSAAFDELAALYNEDSQKLGLVYYYAKLSWGKYSPNLIILGFAPSVVRPGGGQPDAPESFAYDKPTHTFSWGEVAGATSYQLVYSADMDIWDEVYSGEDTSFMFDPGAGEWHFRVRARDIDGYGDWSEVMTLNFNGGALAAPTGFIFDDKTQVFLWKKVHDADSYQLEYSRDGGQIWIPKYEGADAKFDGKHLDPGKAWARVRALNATETSPWGITLEVWLGLPNVPQNLRWHPEEHSGTLMACIEWDIAAGAHTYELIYLNGGDEVYGGPLTREYQGIMDAPGEHRYHVRAWNDFGFSEWSETLVIVIV